MFFFRLKKKNLYGFSVFYKVFSKNRITIFLKIVINIVEFRYLVICWFCLLPKLLQFVKIINNFFTVFLKNIYGFSVFYNVFSNRIKILLDLDICWF